MFLLLIFVLSVFGCKVNTRDDYLDCFSRYFDLNHDDIITPLEIDTSVANNFNMTEPLTFNGAMIIQHCDMNNDSVLTVAGDWNNQTSCLQKHPITGWNLYSMLVCDICVMKYHWTIPARKK